MARCAVAMLVAAVALAFPAAASARTTCVWVEQLHVCSTPVRGGHLFCAHGTYAHKRVDYCVVRRDRART
ncbi:MAG: hypothetical protein QOF54_845 [Solirubrobacteraceae bacterium]|jgi:hypothetical protein|nr:hypothetical protein [Solirubrobacteraceae bacterium]